MKYCKGSLFLLTMFSMVMLFLCGCLTMPEGDSFDDEEFSEPEVTGIWVSENQSSTTDNTWEISIDYFYASIKTKTDTTSYNIYSFSNYTKTCILWCKSSTNSSYKNKYRKVTWQVDNESLTTFKLYLFKRTSNEAMNCSEDSTLTIKLRKKCYNPYFHPEAITYLPPINVVISSANNNLTSIIYYTLDGSEPDSNSTRYINPIHLTESATFKAIVYDRNCIKSEVVSKQYDLSVPQIANMVFVMGGKYWKGNPDYPEDELYEEVIAPSFYMSTKEVTQGEWRSIMHQPYGATNRPIYGISWNRALQYCNKRSIREGLTPCYKADDSTNPEDWHWMKNLSVNTCANGYRLPSEIEWEYAAKGGIQTHNYLYSGSNTLDNVAWYLGNSGSSNQEVGTKQPNELGIYDLTGNEMEYCFNYFNYPTNNQIVYRGGSFLTNDSNCRITARFSIDPNIGNIIVGFRVVRTRK